MDKYYQPSIEELFVGYEYEEYKHYRLLIDGGEEKPEYWKPNKIAKDYLYSDNEGNSDIQDLLWLLDKSRIRTKYLTKEDIESLGWVGNDGDYFKCDTDTSYSLIHSPTANRILIKDEVEGEYLFRGEIKSMNELKYLSKLLGL